MAETKDKKIHSCSVSVRWGDMDFYGHVNNALYLRYLEEARIQLLVKLGAKLDGLGLDPVTVNVGCTFMRPIDYPDTLRIDCYVANPGRSSFMVNYEIFSAADPENPVSEGHTKVVWIDHRTGRSVPLPDEVRSRLV